MTPANPAAPVVPGPSSSRREYARDDVDSPRYESYPDHVPGMLRFSPALGMELALRSQIQTIGGWVGDESLLTEGDPMQLPGYRMLRSRFGVEGTLVSDVSFLLELELFDQERTGGPLYEAWVDLGLPLDAGITVGLQQLPFSQGQAVSSLLLTHLDRGLAVRAMSPENALGAVLHAPLWRNRLLLSAGLFNGIQRHPTFLQGYEGIGITEGNRFERMLYAAKLDVIAMGRIGQDVADVHSGRKLRLAGGLGGFINDGGNVFSRSYSGYLQAKFRGLHLFAEALIEHSEPQVEPTTTDNTLAATTDRFAVHGDVGYMVLPRRLGASVRVEYLDDNQDRDDNGDELAVTGTLTYYMVRDLLKLMLEGTHREELHGTSISNDAVLGGLQLAF